MDRYSRRYTGAPVFKIIANVVGLAGLIPVDSDVAVPLESCPSIRRRACHGDEYGQCEAVAIDQVGISPHVRKNQLYVHARPR